MSFADTLERLRCELLAVEGRTKITVRRADLRDLLEDWERLDAEVQPQGDTSQQVQPIPMVLHCPKCHMQHIDAPERATESRPVLYSDAWCNPPHRSHLCRPEDGGCGHIWRPADVPTTGVAAVSTKGKADSPTLAPVVQAAGPESDESEDVMRIALELIALGQSLTPRLTAQHALVAAGIWRPDAEVALAAHSGQHPASREPQPALSVTGELQGKPGVVLHRMKYHVHAADPELGTEEDWELFPADVDCPDCIDVLIVRAALTGAAPQAQPEVLPHDGNCAECGKHHDQNFALYCADCVMKVAELVGTAATPAPAQVAQADAGSKVEKLMEQAQVFASAWSMVGGPFDSGNAMEDAEQAKDELRTMLVSALTQGGGQC